MTDTLATSVAPSSRSKPMALLALSRVDASALVVGGRHREGQVRRGAVGGHVLHDHVDIDIAVGERTENRGGDSRLVLHPTERDLRLVLGKGDPGDDLLFHDVSFVANKRA